MGGDFVDDVFDHVQPLARQCRQWREQAECTRQKQFGAVHG